MHRKGLSASRIGCAHLVISAVLAEAVRDKMLAESPCTGIQLPGVVSADFVLPAHAQVEAVAAGLPPDWSATVWLMHGCGLRIGEALAVLREMGRQTHESGGRSGVLIIWLMPVRSLPRKVSLWQGLSRGGQVAEAAGGQQVARRDGAGVGEH